MSETDYLDDWLVFCPDCEEPMIASPGDEQIVRSVISWRCVVWAPGTDVNVRVQVLQRVRVQLDKTHTALFQRVHPAYEGWLDECAMHASD